MLNVVVDLSHWNKTVNFKLAKNDGIVGVICKATTGTGPVDPSYFERRSAAAEEGLLCGAYHFGTGLHDGTSQADYFLSTVGDTSNTLIALDLEINPSGATITPKQADDFVKRILEVVGRYPVVYGSKYFLEKFGNTSVVKCPLWIASYAKKPNMPKYWDQWTLWQYTNGTKGPKPHTVNGIGLCDRDRFNGTIEELKQFWYTESC